MSQSESLNELAKALNAVQTAIKPALKDSANPYFKSKYADLNAVWCACRKELGENGLAVTQTLNTETNGLCCLRTVLMHTSGQWISGMQILNPVKNDPQGLGSAITYARRYGLAAIVGIVADEDDDGNAASGNAIGKGVATKLTSPYKRAAVITGTAVSAVKPDPLAGTGLNYV